MDSTTIKRILILNEFNIYMCKIHARIQKVLSGVQLRQRFLILWVFFVVDEGREDPITSINGPSSAQIDCWLGSFVIDQGFWTSIAKKPITL